jgi:hypothetical protein
MYAKDMGVSVEEAMRRLELQQSAFPDLESRLMKNERETFAGLWIRHKPDYRIVVWFTEGGEETIRRYIEGDPNSSLVVVRNGADATLAELMTTQEAAIRVAEEVGVPADSDINIRKNRAELYVTDRQGFCDALREAGLWLPEYVVVIEVERLATPD